MELVSEIELNVIEYLKTPPNESELQDLISRFDGPIEDLIRWSDSEAPAKPESITKEVIIQLILEYPKHLQRPILDNGTTAIVCRPPEKALSLM